MDRWLTKLQAEKAESTVTTYYYRLKLFVEWCESEGIEEIGAVTGWDIEQFEIHRREQNPTTVSLNNEFTTLQNWFRYLARIEVVDDMPDKIEIPQPDPEEKSSDKKLHEDAALALLEHYRDDPQRFGTRGHALLELLWHVGMRANAVVALDLRDMRETDDGTRYLAVENRPETGTRLKKGINGERPVRLSSTTWDVLDHYVEHYRLDVHDDYGRQPLIASKYGRPIEGTIRDWCYNATVPCIHSDCPHGNDPAVCEFLRYEKASGCPSSRSPHHVRTGAITWMRNRGVPAEIVAERVNASVETIEEHYDKENPVDEMIKRRDPHFADFDIDPS
jgi:site-specific recombinase XerD